MTRDYNPEYYDLTTTSTEDLVFYEAFVDDNTTVLELGCGTGRISIPLAPQVKSLTGVDLSAPMLERAKSKTPEGLVTYVLGDITSIRLGRRFDLIIAPYRTFQALEFDEQVDGFFDVVRQHLAPDGRVVVSAFNPRHAKDEMEQKWPDEQESPRLEVTCPNGDTLVWTDLYRRLDADRQVIYPELIYRRYQGGELIDKHVNPICMKYYYPDELEAVVIDHGFELDGRWGGYQGEVYGQGRELVISFRLPG